MVLFPNKIKKLSPFHADVTIKFLVFLTFEADSAGNTRNREFIKPVRTLVLNRLNFMWI